MATLTTDPTATIKSATMEGALLELIAFLKISEQDLTKNTQNLDNVSGSFDLDTSTFTGDFTIPITVGVTSTGSLETVAVNYFTNLTYSAGLSSNTLKSTNPVAAIMELIQLMQLKESQATKNPQSLNYVTGKIDPEIKTFSANITIPCTLSLGSTGLQVVTAKEYLLN